MNERQEVYVVMNETYNTFGTNGTYSHGFFSRRDTAEKVAEELNKHWGNRAWIAPRTNPIIYDIAPEEVEANWYQGLGLAMSADW